MQIIVWIDTSNTTTYIATNVTNTYDHLSVNLTALITSIQRPVVSFCDNSRISVLGRLHHAYSALPE